MSRRFLFTGRLLTQAISFQVKEHNS